MENISNPSNFLNTFLQINNTEQYMSGLNQSPPYIFSYS